MTPQEKQWVSKLRDLQHQARWVRDSTDNGRKGLLHPDRRAAAERYDELEKMIDNFIWAIQDKEKAERAYRHARLLVCDTLNEVEPSEGA